MSKKDKAIVAFLDAVEKAHRTYDEAMLLAIKKCKKIYIEEGA